MKRFSITTTDDDGFPEGRYEDMVHQSEENGLVFFSYFQCERKKWPYAGVTFRWGYYEQVRLEGDVYELSKY